MSVKTQCKKCGSAHVVKAGKIAGNQRYKCKDCGCQFQPNRRKGKPESTKRLAVLLYSCGLSMRTIAKIVKTDVHAVYRWIRKFAEESYSKSEPKSETVIVELDEMWHFINDKKTNSGYGRLIAVTPVNLSTGNVEGETMLLYKLYELLKATTSHNGIDSRDSDVKHVARCSLKKIVDCPSDFMRTFM